MVNSLKKWIYTGLDLNLAFDDIPVPVNQKSKLPDSLIPDEAMQAQFRRAAVELGYLKCLDS